MLCYSSYGPQIVPLDNHLLPSLWMAQSNKSAMVACKKVIRLVYFTEKIPPNTFFLTMLKKKTTEHFLKFPFLFESTILPVNNEK